MICGWAKELEVGLLLVAATVVLILSTSKESEILGAGNFSGVLAGLGDP